MQLDQPLALPGRTWNSRTPAIAAVSADPDLLLFQRRNKDESRCYVALTRGEWHSKLLVDYDEDLHTVRTHDAMVMSVDLDGVEGSDADPDATDALVLQMLLILNVLAPGTFLVAAEMTRPGHFSSHLVARGPALGPFSRRHAAAVLALAATRSTGSADPVKELQQRGIQLDFNDFKNPHGCMRAVGSRRSTGAGNKRPTRKYTIVGDTLHVVDIDPTDADARGWLDLHALPEPSTDPAYAHRLEQMDAECQTLVPLCVRRKLPIDQHEEAAAFIAKKRKRSSTTGAQPLAVANKAQKVERVADDEAGVYASYKSQYVPRLEAFMTGLGRPYTAGAFQVNKMTAQGVRMENGQTLVTSLKVHGNGKMFNYCFKKCGCHKHRRDPLVICDMASGRFRWICPWGSTCHDNPSVPVIQSSALLSMHHTHCRETSLTCKHSAVAAITPPTVATEVADMPDLARIKATVYWLGNSVAEVLTVGNNLATRSSGEVVSLVIDTVGQRQMPDYVDNILSMKAATRGPGAKFRVLILKMTNSEFGDSSRAIVTGFEDCLLLHRVLKMLLPEKGEACVGVCITEPTLVELMHLAAERPAQNGVSHVRILSTVSPVVLREGGGMSDNGIVVGLESVWQLYDSVRPLVQLMTDGGRMRCLQTNDPLGLLPYLRHVRSESRDRVWTVILSPWVVATREVYGTNAGPDAVSSTAVRVTRSDSVVSDAIAAMSKANEAAGKRGLPVVYVLWDTQQWANSTLAPVLRWICNQVVTGPTPMHTVPQVSILCAGHSHPHPDGASLVQAMMTHVPVSMLVIPDDLKETAALDLAPAFAAMCTDLRTSLRTLETMKVLRLLPVQRSLLEKQAPEVHAMCAAARKAATVVKWYTGPSPEHNWARDFVTDAETDKLRWHTAPKAGSVSDVVLAVTYREFAPAGIKRVLWDAMQQMPMPSVHVLMGDAAAPVACNQGAVKFGHVHAI